MKKKQKLVNIVVTYSERGLISIIYNLGGSPQIERREVRIIMMSIYNLDVELK